MEIRESEIFPVGYKHEIAQRNFQIAVLDGISRSVYRNYTDRELADPAKIWGYRDKGKGTWRQLESGDYLLFYPGGGEYRYAARISGKEHNPEFGEDVFQTPDQLFEYIVYLDALFDISIESRELHMDFAGYKIDHPVKSQSFNDQTYEAIQERYGSIQEYIDAHKVDNVVVFTDELESGSKASDVERPKRVKTTVDRIVRDTGIVRDLKEFYNYQCQICSEVRQRTSSAPYAEGHHIHPLGHDPPGPDKRENILVLCPNHHADFDYGMIQLDSDDLEISHAYEEDVDGEVLRVHNNHEIEREHIEYHNQNISSITQS